MPQPFFKHITLTGAAKSAVSRFVLPGLSLVLMASGCAVIKNSTAPIRLANEVNVIEDIDYNPPNSNLKQRLDLFIPRSSPGVSPVAVFVHGGYWKNQDKRYFRPVTGLYWNFGFALAQQGFLTAVISYRLFPESRIDGQINDVRTAVAWVGAHAGEYGGDGDQIHLIGHSAGGHLVAMVGLNDHSNVRSIVALSPILDIVHMKEFQTSDFNREIVFPVFGSSDDDLRRRSPIEFWSSKAPPLNVIIGSDDYPFVFEQCRQFSEKAQTENWNVRLETLKGFEHADLVLSVTNKDSTIIQKAIKFMRQHN